MFRQRKKKKKKKTLRRTRLRAVGACPHLALQKNVHLVTPYVKFKNEIIKLFITI